MDNQKLKEIFSDKEFIKTLLNLETGEEVKKVLSQHGIPINDETLKILAVALVNALENQGNTKIIEDSVLSSVSGGKTEIIKSEEYAQYKGIISESIDSSLTYKIPQNSWILKETDKLQ